MIIVGIAIGLLIGYLLFRNRQNPAQTPLIDYTQLRDQAAREVELWQDAYDDDIQKQVIREVADHMRRGELPQYVAMVASSPAVVSASAITPAYPGLDGVPTVAAAQAAQPVMSVAAEPRNPHDDMVSILAYLGAFIVVAGITVFSVQAEGVARFLWLFFMSALFYVGGMSLRNIASLKNVGNTFLAIGLIAAPFAMLSVGDFSGLAQPAVWFLSSVVSALLYGFTASVISSKLLQYVFLASVFVTGQTAMANLTTDFSWFMLTLSTTGLLIAVVQRVVGMRSDSVDRTTTQITQIAVLAGAVLSVFSLAPDVSQWPVVVATQLVSALYFYYNGLYESVHSSERQSAWSVAQVLVIVAVTLAAGASQTDIKAASLALAAIGLVYSAAFLALAPRYKQLDWRAMRLFHVAVIASAVPLALVLSMFASDFESARVVLLAISIVQFASLQFVHKLRDASWGWGFGLWLLPAIVINQLYTDADVSWYVGSYAALSVFFVALWLIDWRNTKNLGAYTGCYVLSAVSLVISAVAWNEWAVASALLGLSVSVAVVAWRISVEGVASVALSLALVSFAAFVDAGGVDTALTFGSLFVTAATAYILARMIPLYTSERFESLSLELRITAGGFILLSATLSAFNGSTLVALIAFYAFCVVLMAETWRFGQAVREVASISLLFALWLTLAYNAIDNWLVYTYVAALYTAVVAVWHRTVAGAGDPQYRSLVLIAGFLTGLPVALAALADKETYALAAILQNVVLVLIGLYDEFKALRWIGFWTVIALISLQLLTYGFLFLWFVGAILIGLAIFFALRGGSHHDRPLT